MLELENIEYEKANLIKNIGICRDYKAKNAKPDIIPLEEFVALNPTVAKEVANDQHLLYIARLKFELFQRRKLLKDLEEGKKKCDAMSKECQEKKQFLEGMSSLIHNICQSVTPFEQYMSVSSSPSMAATTLPLPLPLASAIDDLSPMLFSLFHSLQLQTRIHSDINSIVNVLIAGGKHVVLSQRFDSSFA
ncbi:hypothetical protein RFI_20032 [Reticulomyxa filosa]|uniref:Uncharacterized protein n=1 Tax=Reticulomyxa filosa TaxID=46433 RepID=X6MTJ2_RETFI|nr:hypothetical protein RFI_20032 [Reticulomyxa filosa]|eukprot:ETO17293.1 hypothetical protein RFI_20032 [Reticulomyxa filosa]